MHFAPVQKKLFGWILLFMLLVTLDRSHAANVGLAWDQSPDSDVVGYNIYYGTATGVHSTKVSAEAMATTTVSNLTCGETYFFVATAFNSSGVESDFSNEIQFTIPGDLTLRAGSTPGGPPEITFPVAPPHWYEVQATTDLQSWSTIWQTGVATSNDWVQFSDPQAAEFPSRFYRLILH